MLILQLTIHRVVYKQKFHAQVKAALKLEQIVALHGFGNTAE